MKGVFVILDGVADKPCSSLNNKTPLEIAKTPNLDELAKNSKIDYCPTVKEGISPTSSNAIVSLFGQNPVFVSRGALESMGAGVKFAKGDLVFRTNFATIDNLENLTILDRRAGRTLSTKEAIILAKEINKKVKLPFKFEFIPTVQHRGVLIFRGGFSDNITSVDTEYSSDSSSVKKIKFSHPIDDEDDSKLSAEIINNFTRQSFEVLSKHPLNIARAKKGFFAANCILARDPGNSPVKFKKLSGKWMAIGYMPLEIGVAKSFGMDIYKFRCPKLKKTDIYKTLNKGLKKAVKNSIKMLKWNRKKYDYFYIHIKETDIPGHDNLPKEKVKMIEFLDEKFFSFLKKFIKKNKLIITADHTTSCELKTHTADPVPVLTYPSNPQKNHRFTESDALKGRKILGRKLLEENLF